MYAHAEYTAGSTRAGVELVSGGLCHRHDRLPFNVCEPELPGKVGLQIRTLVSSGGRTMIRSQKIDITLSMIMSITIAGSR